MTEIPGLFGTNWPEPDDVVLLRVLLHADLDVSKRAWSEFAPRWDADAPTSDQYRLFPILAERLALIAPDDPRLGMLQGVRRQATIQTMLLLDRLDRVLELFESVNIEPIVLKGGALALNLYDNVGQRPAHDLDLAVGPDRFDEARAVLLAAGWAQTAEDTLGRHAVSFGLDGDEVDLHRQVNRELVIPGKPLAALQRFDVVRAERPLRSGRRVRVLNHTDALVHTIVHGLDRTGATNLRWVVDATRLIGTGAIDWSRFVELTKLFGLAPLMHSGLTFVVSVAGVELPADLLSELSAIRLSPFERARLWAFHVWGPIDGPFRGLPRTISRLLEATRDRTFWGVVAASPAYLAEVWGASSVWGLPGAVLRKVRRVRSSA